MALTCSRDVDYSATPAEYDTLATFQKSRGKLFASLEKVKYLRPEEMYFKVFRSFHVLFGPTLQDVYIWDLGVATTPLVMAKSVRADMDMFDHMKAIAPSPRELSVTICCRCINAILAMSSILPAAVLHLARLPHLRTLESCADETFLAGDPQHIGQTVRAGEQLFPAVQELQITGPSLVLQTKLLGLIRTPPAQPSPAPMNKKICRTEIATFCAAIERMPVRKCLERLYVEAQDVMPTELSAPPSTDGGRTFRPLFQPVDGEDLVPLLALSKLDDMVLQTHCPSSTTPS
ncbi:hypothetical protein BC628DRAFT_1418962 [Trametes gibbosa]|nr:hypothetical protein BC628DRAFT_1418962 [Trametes gibbosa]